MYTATYTTGAQKKTECDHKCDHGREIDAESDERLLKLIQAWERLTPARQRMIESIVERSE